MSELTEAELLRRLAALRVPLPKSGFDERLRVSLLAAAREPWVGPRVVPMGRRRLLAVGGLAALGVAAAIALLLRPSPKSSTLTVQAEPLPSVASKPMPMAAPAAVPERAVPPVPARAPSAPARVTPRLAPTPPLRPVPVDPKTESVSRERPRLDRLEITSDLKTPGTELSAPRLPLAGRTPTAPLPERAPPASERPERPGASPRAERVTLPPPGGRPERERPGR